jgi:DNA-binding NarL/FixJ family response regulator
MDQPIRIVLVDAHPIFIEGLKAVLEKSEETRFEIVAEASTGNALLKHIEGMDADLILLDMNLPDMDGLEVLTNLKARGIETKVLTMSTYDEPKIVKSAFKAGTYGYVLKNNSINELFKAIQTVLEGESYMSVGLSLTNTTGMHTQFMHNGKVSVSFEDRFIKKFKLTKREIEVLKLVGKAMSNKEIAKELYISDQTVSVHRKNIMKKLDVNTTASLIRFSYEHNLL